jgi:hypothetical protein
VAYWTITMRNQKINPGILLSTTSLPVSMSSTQSGLGFQATSWITRI